MSNGRWGTGARPNLQIAQAQQVDVESMQAAQEQNARVMMPIATADSLLGQAKVRLEAIEAELRTKASLEAEKAKLEKMIAALEET